MKKINRDKLMGTSVVLVLMLVALVVGIKLYEKTLPEKHDDQVIQIEENDILVDNLEVEAHEVIEEAVEETELNIRISETEEVQLTELNENTTIIEKPETTSFSTETLEGKTLITVNEKEPEVPEVPTVANEESLTDSTKEPQYNEEPAVEEDQTVEGDVVKTETDTKSEKDIPAGVNTTPAEESENPFLKLGPPPSGDVDGVDATEYYEDGRTPGQGDKF